jgi:hypothetical protein
VSIRAVYRYLGKKLEGNAKTKATEILDFTGASRFLVFELVARKAEDFQTAVSIRLKQPLQAVILGSETSFTGHVDNEQYLAPVRGQGRWGSVDGLELKIINGCHVNLP